MIELAMMWGTTGGIIFIACYVTGVGVAVSAIDKLEACIKYRKPSKAVRYFFDVWLMVMFWPIMFVLYLGKK